MIPIEIRPCLSAATRQASAPILLTRDNLEEIGAPHCSTTVSQRIEKLLRFVASKCGRPGSIRGINFDIDYPIADCGDSYEFSEYVNYLADEGLLKVYLDEISESVSGYAPTIKGWQVVQPTLTPGPELDRCFVAMWFSNELDAVYSHGFERAITECGFKAFPNKDDPTNKSVVDRILSYIRRSRFVIADFTGKRQSVYYEAGFAAGLGREVIGCCREDWASELAFDTRHLGHVVWKNADDLYEKLASSIRANIIPQH